MELKHGLIGRFKFSPEKEITGILINNGVAWVIIDSTGHTTYLNALLGGYRIKTDDVDVTSVRFSNSKIRTTLNAIAAVYSGKLETQAEINRLSAKIHEFDKLVDDQVKRLKDIQYNSLGFGDFALHLKVCEAVEGYFRQNMFKDSCKAEVTPIISTRCGIDNGALILSVVETVYIEKYASPSKYPFIAREYDGLLYVDDEHPMTQCVTQSYDKACILTKVENEWKHKCDSVESNRDLGVGDKNTLTFYKRVSFMFKTGRSFENFCKYIGVNG